MESKADKVAQKVGTLALAPAGQKGLCEFVSQVIDLYATDLVSVSAIGSTVTGDYDEEESDINLLVVYSDMEITELERVANLSRRWLRKQRLAPRFISRRNLDESVRYFQVDFLAMRDAHIVLWGEDVLAAVETDREALRWQIAYQVKAMRMRIKQQFWRTVGDEKMMRSVLVGRFKSLTHLTRALLMLYNLPAPVSRRDTIDAAAEHFGVDRAFCESMLALRLDKSPPDSRALAAMFEGLMQMVRTIDARVEEVKV